MSSLKVFSGSGLSVCQRWLFVQNCLKLSCCPPPPVTRSVIGTVFSQMCFEISLSSPVRLNSFIGSSFHSFFKSSRHIHKKGNSNILHLLEPPPPCFVGQQGDEHVRHGPHVERRLEWLVQSGLHVLRQLLVPLLPKGL